MRNYFSDATYRREVLEKHPVAVRLLVYVFIVMSVCALPALLLWPLNVVEIWGLSALVLALPIGGIVYYYRVEKPELSRSPKNPAPGRTTSATDSE